MKLCSLSSGRDINPSKFCKLDGWIFSSDKLTFHKKKFRKNSWEPREKLNETAKEAIEQWTNTKVKIEEKKAASAAKKEARKKEAKAKRDAKKEAKKAAKQENSKEAESATEKLVTAKTASPEQTTAEAYKT